MVFVIFDPFAEASYCSCLRSEIVFIKMCSGAKVRKEQREKEDGRMMMEERKKETTEAKWGD